MKTTILILIASIFCIGNAFAQNDTIIEPTSSDCIDCIDVVQIEGSSAIGQYTEATGLNSFASGLSTKAQGDYSSALGYNSTASGLGSFSIGNYNNVTGDYSFSLGSFCSVTGQSNGVAIGLHAISAARNAYSFGSFLESYAPGSIVIGTGSSKNDKLRNTKQESLVVGFNSIHPSLFVGMSPSMHETGKIGIGTDEPATKLHMYSGVDEDAILFLQPKNYTTSDDYAAIFLGNQQNQIKTTHNGPMEFLTESKFVFNGSNVGIGISNPQYSLDVSGQVRLSSLASNGDEPKMLVINQNGLLENADIPEKHIFTENIQMQGNYISHDGDSEGIYLAENGKVGIGEVTEMPGEYLLYVERGILTEKVRVKLQGEWADYVFDEDYDLMPLSEVESFIKENKHLPDVPSAKEVKKEGMDVAEMNALLLKKVEELTLHIIELEKKVNQLQKEQE